ncbi:UDP-glucose 4-epimerase GalE [Sulfurospirillum sp. 1307]|jgi:UDP-glucose 4-epimerase
MNILITGGAGYIGSHIIKKLGELTSHKITIIDNLSTGFEENILFGELIKEDLGNPKKLEEVFQKKDFDVIIHFAANIVVPESVQNPLKYYMNNTINTANLIDLAIRYDVKKFIFSSSAAVYGDIENMSASENSIKNPINPYGWSKLMSEQMLIDAAIAHKNFKYIILRYFNVAGASLDNKIGQSFPNATHLIKIASETAIGAREKMYIFGDNYDTLDGTCIRDYIHVEDLASAHLTAIEYNKSEIFNCGYGKGSSVKEVVNAMKKVSGVDFDVEICDRREGDAGILIADNSKILKLTKWRPKYDNLELICKTALDWEKKRLL